MKQEVGSTKAARPHYIDSEIAPVVVGLKNSGTIHTLMAEQKVDVGAKLQEEDERMGGTTLVEEVGNWNDAVVGQHV